MSDIDDEEEDVILNGDPTAQPPEGIIYGTWDGLQYDTINTTWQSVNSICLN